MCSVEDAALIGGDHILDINEGVFSSVDLEKLESRLDEVSKVLALSLAVVDLVSKVVVANLEQVQHGEDLTVVGYKSLSYGVTAGDESL